MGKREERGVLSGGNSICVGAMGRSVSLLKTSVVGE